MNVTFTRAGAAAGAVTLGLSLAAAPVAAASEPAGPGEPWCEITEVVNGNPDSSDYEGVLDWWGVGFRASEGLEDWSFHFVNKAPGEVWIYDYYLRPDLEASEAAGHLVIPHNEGGRYLVDESGASYFALLVPDDDPEAPVVECVAG